MKRISVFSLFVLLVLSSLFIPGVRASEPAEPIGSLYFSPPVDHVAAGTPFTVTVKVSIGPDAKLNIAQVTLRLDPAFTVSECSAADLFQGIGSRAACVRNGDTMKIMVESKEAAGPSGEVVIANVTLVGSGSSEATITLSDPEIVIRQPDGRSVLLDITHLEKKSYTFASTPLASQGETLQGGNWVSRLWQKLFGWIGKRSQ
jgi:hypothetical protein